MQNTLLKEIFRETDKFGGKKVSVSGWIRNIRISKNFGFIELNDGSFFSNIQIVIEEDKLENFAELSKLNVGAAIIVTGKLVATPEMRQPVEIQAEKIEEEGASTPD